jgi:hypothetical protein
LKLPAADSFINFGNQRTIHQCEGGMIVGTAENRQNIGLQHGALSFASTAIGLVCVMAAPTQRHGFPADFQGAQTKERCNVGQPASSFNITTADDVAAAVPILTKSDVGQIARPLPSELPAHRQLVGEETRRRLT